MVQVEIIETKIIQVPKRDEVVSVVKVCYRYGDILTRCIWIDQDEFNEENLKKMIKADLERALKEVRGVLELP